MAPSVSSRSYTATGTLGKPIYGIPLSTFIATCLSGGIYAIQLILFLSLKCQWTEEKYWFFFGCLAAFASIGFVLILNIFYPRFRFSTLSLTASLLFSATAGLVIWLLANAFHEGICPPAPSQEERQEMSARQVPQLGTFELDTNSTLNKAEYLATVPSGTLRPITSRSNMGNLFAPQLEAPQRDKNIFSAQGTDQIILWIITIPAVAFQIVAHYYFG